MSLWSARIHPEARDVGVLVPSGKAHYRRRCDDVTGQTRVLFRFNVLLAFSKTTLRQNPKTTITQHGSYQKIHRRGSKLFGAPNPRRERLTSHQPFLNTGCGLGEAPFWEESTNTLRFVDIVKEKLHTVDLNKGPSSHVEVPLDISIGITADLEGDQASGKFAFGGKHGYGIFDRQTAEHHYITRYWSGESDQAEKEHAMRGNDGAVDSHGRFWVGTMCDPKVKSPTDIGEVSWDSCDLSSKG